MNNLVSKFKQQIVFLICCFSFITAAAQPETLSEKAEISVLTCGTANEMHTLFGHTALRIKDVDQNYQIGLCDNICPPKENIEIKIEPSSKLEELANKLREEELQKQLEQEKERQEELEKAREEREYQRSRSYDFER